MEKVLRLYRQQAPVVEVVKAYKEIEGWVEEEVQDEFVTVVMEDEVVGRYRGVGKYPWGVCKGVVKEVEGNWGAVSDRLIEKCVSWQPRSEGIDGELGGMGRELEHSWKSFTLEGGEVVSIKVWPQFSHVGLALWPAGFAVAEWVIAHKNELLDARIVELGSGVGLTGVVAGLTTQAKHSTMTDYLPAVNENALENIKENHVESRCTVDELDWVKAAASDPATLALIKSYDATHLLAADVVYDRDVVPALTDTFRAFLTHSPSLKQVVFAITLRNEETFQYLLENLLRNDLVLTATETPSPTGIFHYDPSLITIYSLALKG